ncbi:protein REVEILLE 2-like [Gossypium australe]|uniref:Cyclin-dependent kinases regulatory subunit n=1 Tax=Gossypium australe TaxID=47621 RepID=A0A5B6WSH3_9ROSI|nr:protein REVEILLE 2-like [Gossypium australe]
MIWQTRKIGQIQYSEKYVDDTYGYRHVVLPPEVAKLLPKNRLLSELIKRVRWHPISQPCHQLAHSLHQREKWTEEEHQRFLEALRLHGHGWRQIEEHAGTKSAVQIRSHAQKFFSKVVRESNGGFDGSIKRVVIMPPRPKRKPIHPYPRKSVNH